MDHTHFKKIFNATLTLKKAVAVWKLPSEDLITGIVDLDPQIDLNQSSKIDLHQLGDGFLIQNFDNTKPNSQEFINASWKFNNNESFFLPEKSQNANQQIWDEFIRILAQDESLTSPLLPLLDNNEIKNSSKSDYQNLVEKTVQTIQNDTIKKIVVARKKTFSTNHTIDLVDIFFKLTTDFPEAFVALVYHPKFGCWIGASPELLIGVSNNIFKTVALAGTKRMKTNEGSAQINWSQKEIEEQALVARYIINCFKTIRLREYEDNGPRTVMAGHLAHLKTSFEVDMKTTGYNNLANQMLELLHPTSAVCGMPKAEALEFISLYENLDRSLYTGYWGPVMSKSISLFVNIRCAQVFQNAFTLYAGAGITKDSIPSKEFLETEAKMETLLKYLN